MNAVDLEVISLRLAAENRVVVKNQCLAGRVETVKMVRRRQARKSATDDDQVELLLRIGNADTSEASRAYVVRRTYQPGRIAMGSGIVTRTAWPVPVVTDRKVVILRWCRHLPLARAAAGQCATQNKG